MRKHTPALLLLNLISPKLRHGLLRRWVPRADIRHDAGHALRRTCVWPLGMPSFASSACASQTDVSQVNGAVLNFVRNSTTITLFALAIVIAVANFFFVIFILPESLPLHKRIHSRSSTTYSHRASGVPDGAPPRRKTVGRMLKKGVTSIIRQLVRPIALFVPQPLDRGRKGRDWNLALTGAALFIYVLSIVSFALWTLCV